MSGELPGDRFLGGLGLRSPQERLKELKELRGGENHAWVRSARLLSGICALEISVETEEY